MGRPRPRRPPPPGRDRPRRRGCHRRRGRTDQLRGRTSPSRLLPHPRPPPRRPTPRPLHRLRRPGTATAERDIRARPYNERRAALLHLLAELPANTPIQAVSATTDRDTALTWYTTLHSELGVEGIVAKRATSPYRAGRTAGWQRSACRDCRCRRDRLHRAQDSASRARGTPSERTHRTHADVVGAARCTACAGPGYGRSAENRATQTPVRPTPGFLLASPSWKSWPAPPATPS